jgi:hypothetical protein
LRLKIFQFCLFFKEVKANADAMIGE